MPYPTKLKGDWQKPCQVWSTTAQHRYGKNKATRKFANKYRDIFQNNMAEGPKDPQGSIFLPRRRQDLHLLPVEMLQNIQKSPLFKKMQKDCQAEGIEIPKTLMAKDPVTHVLTTGIFTKCGSRDNASDKQSSNDEGNGRKHDCE